MKSKKKPSSLLLVIAAASSADFCAAQTAEAVRVKVLVRYLTCIPGKESGSQVIRSGIEFGARWNHGYYDVLNPSPRPDARLVPI